MKTYSVTYEVQAVTDYEAHVKAVQMLREGVRYIRLDAVVWTAPGWWKVTLRVSEDS